MPSLTRSGYAELTVRENACRGLSPQKGESCLAVKSGNAVRAGAGRGTIVANGQREDGRRLVSAATVARKFGGQGHRDGACADGAGVVSLN